jgi:Zn-dependent M28 family amino/carboxypeptidase
LVVVVLLLAAGEAGTAAEKAFFDGERAFADLRRLAAYGPRPSGSDALRRARQDILRQLQQAGVKGEEDNFLATTPLGRVPMTNIIAKIPGKSPKVVLLAGHYETKLFRDFAFVGANDGGSSAACLLELARALARRKNDFTYWVVFFDGEEAMVEYSATDGLYGSRHLVQKLSASGELSRVQAMIVVDMVGDRNLNIYRDANSTAWLTDLVFGVARQLGYGRYFRDEPRAYEDDHLPFVRAGVSAIDLIDFEYGPRNRYWHTPDDTVDKCSPQSLAIVGRVVLATLDELEKNSRLQ